QIVRMRRNGEAATLVNHLAHFARRLAFEIGQGRADAKQVTISGSDLHARQDKKIIDRQAVEPHQTFLEQVTDGVAGIVVGDGKAVQSFLTPSRDHVFRAGNAVTGKKGMRVQVDVERHFPRRLSGSARQSQLSASTKKPASGSS